MTHAGHIGTASTNRKQTYYKHIILISLINHQNPAYLFISLASTYKSSAIYLYIRVDDRFKLIVYYIQLIMRGGPVYIVKPKYIFKHPFNKYDLANPTNRETQNEELTDYFNYGFNEDTMNIYGKLVKRYIQVLDHHKNLEYFNQPSQLMRLNDQMPMDFGGFCKFHDPWIVDNETSENFHNGDILLKYFIMTIYANISRKIQYPLIEFVKSMYKKEGEQQSMRDTFVYDVIEQIDKNLEIKYQETMKKIYQKQNQIKVPLSQKKTKEEKREKDPKDRQRDRERQKQKEREKDKDKEREKDRERDREREKERQKQKQKQKQKQREKMKEQVKPKRSEKRRQQSSEQSEISSEDGSSLQSEAKKKRRHERQRSSERGRKREGRQRSRKRERSSSRKRKQKKEKHKSKKVKKQKSYRRSKSKSRDRKKKHH